MKDDLQERAEALFQRALDLAPEARTEFLDRECAGDAALRGEVDALLAHHDALPESFLKSPVANVIGDAAPTQIGPYHIKKLLGEGGMGTVYLAEQREPIQREVALKVIKAGLDTKAVMARFQSERQALALMNHPNIARVFDAGATDDGRPYFVMEHIDGPTLTEFCDAERLTIPERVRLFMQVCDGVQYAHQKGIIHRDLKPGNVIVTMTDGHPVPKIIDFGIAKATEQKLTEATLLTRRGDIVGTPEYMSPEQAEQADVDTRTDVYSLGVILYELLTGALPFTHEELRAAGYQAMVERIRDTDPPRPSTRVSALGATGRDTAGRRRTEPRALVRLITGDLDWITMKALEKNPDRRYASPIMLADDLRRHLNHEPVSARAPSTAYRAQKFIRRHTVGVAIVAVGFLAIVAFTVTMAVQTRRIAAERDSANAERDRANQEAESAQEMSDLLVGLFESADPNTARGSEITVREVVDRGAADIKKDDDLDPMIRGRMMHVLGRVYRNLGAYAEAESLLSSSLDEMKSNDAPPKHIIDVLLDLGYRAEIVADYETALRYYDEAMSIARESLVPDAPEIIPLLNRIGTTQTRSGEFETGLATLNEAMQMHERLGLDEDERLAALVNNIGLNYQRLGDNKKTTEMYERSVAIYERILPPDHPSIARGIANIAYAYKNEGRLEEALEVQERATEMLIRVLGENFRETGNAFNMHGAILRDLEKYDEAIVYFERAISSYTNSVGLTHPNMAYPYQNLGKTYQRMGDNAKALTFHEKALEIRLIAHGPDHPNVSMSEYNVGRLKLETGDAAGAEPHLRRAVKITSATYREGNSQRISTSLELGECLVKIGRYDEAETILLATRTTIWSDDDSSASRKRWVTRLLVEAYDEWGKSDLATEYRAELAQLPEDE